MPRHLWLVFEQVGHPDAVSYPASEEDARLAVELLSQPHARRAHLARQLRNFLQQQETLPVLSRQRVPCRRESGLYHPIPWRLAKWLCLVLRAQDAIVDKTRRRIAHWLDSQRQPEILNPADRRA